jgi:hypothetical protein
MTSSWLYETPAVWIVAGLFLAMLLAAEIGYRAARRWNHAATDAGRSNFGAIKGALLGLLALLVAFTYGMAAQRHDARQGLVLAEVNALYGLMLYADMLSEQHRLEFRDLMRRYVDARLQFFYARRDLSRVTEAIATSEKLDAEMWRVLRSEMQRDARTPAIERAVTALVDAWSVQRERVFAFENRIPDPVVWLLLSASVAGLAVVGIGGGLANQRSVLGGTLLAALLCGTIYVVLDLDRPRRGMFEVSQRPMLQLKEALDRGRASYFPATR